MDERLDSLERTITSDGWKILKAEMMAKKESLKDLIVDSNVGTEEGKENIRSYQAMYHAIDAFYDEISDIVAKIRESRKISV